MPTGGSTNTTESGTLDTFVVALDSMPVSNVVIELASTNTSEVTVSHSQLTFTSTDWNVPQRVTVTGVDDGSADGQDVIISLTINTALTADPLYLAVDPHDVVVTNADETAVLFVSKVLASRQQAHVRVGEIVRYNIVTRNDGASAQRLTLTDTLPAGTVFVSAKAGQGTCTSNPKTVVCKLGLLHPSQAVISEIVLRVTAAGKFTNSVAVTSTSGGAATATSSFVTAGLRRRAVAPR